MRRWQKLRIIDLNKEKVKMKKEFPFTLLQGFAKIRPHHFRNLISHRPDYFLLFFSSFFPPPSEWSHSCTSKLWQPKPNQEKKRRKKNKQTNKQASKQTRLMISPMHSTKEKDRVPFIPLTATLHMTAFQWTIINWLLPVWHRNAYKFQGGTLSPQVETVEEEMASGSPKETRHWKLWSCHTNRHTHTHTK